MKDVWCETCEKEIETNEVDECPGCGAIYPDDEELDASLGRAVNVLSILLSKGDKDEPLL